MLRDLKCLNEFDELTPMGKILARLPIEPRIGKSLIVGTIFKCGDTLAACAAYSSSFSELFALDTRQRRLSNHQKQLGGTRCSDHVAMLVAMQMWSKACNRGEEEEIRFCEWKGLQMPTMRVMFETKRQLLDLLQQAGFPEETMCEQYYDQNQPDAALDMSLGLLCIGLYPNVCYHKDKRKVLTTECKAALIHKTSVNCTNLAATFPYPFFVFGEKIRTRAISCKQMTMVSPIHLLLFGSKRVDRVDTTTVRLDNWLLFAMDPYQAALVVALRPAIEQMVLDIAADPEETLNIDEQRQNLITLVRDLCAFDAGDFEIQRSTGLTPMDGRASMRSTPSGFGGGKFGRGGPRGGFGGYTSGFGGNNRGGFSGNNSGGFSGNTGGNNGGSNGFGGNNGGGNNSGGFGGFNRGGYRGGSGFQPRGRGFNRGTNRFGPY